MYPKEHTTVHTVNILVVGGVCWMIVKGLVRSAIALRQVINLMMMFNGFPSLGEVDKTYFS